MNTRKSNKLPDGVGKKIVEALKKQSGSVNKVKQEEKVSSFDELISNHIEENDIENVSYPRKNQQWEESYDDVHAVDDVNVDINDDYDDEYDYSDNDDQSEEFKYHEVMDEEDLDSYDYYNESEDNYNDVNAVYEMYEDQESEEDFVEERSIIKRSPTAPSQRVKRGQEKSPKYQSERQVIPKSEPIGLQVETSSNIEILMGLVSQLPSGVTRQTGAQIIRQTMEAMGFSMNKVLKEAQFAQDEFANAIKNNINTIEEYRNNIKNLEKDVQRFRRKAEELEDLISLFILSEKDRRK